MVDMEQPSHPSMPSGRSGAYMAWKTEMVDWLFRGVDVGFITDEKAKELRKFMGFNMICHDSDMDYDFVKKYREGEVQESELYQKINERSWSAIHPRNVQDIQITADRPGGGVLREDRVFRDEEGVRGRMAEVGMPSKYLYELPIFELEDVIKFLFRDKSHVE